MMEQMKQFVIAEDGVTAIEYGLMGALIALAIVVGATALGSSLGTLFNDVADCVSSGGKTCRLL